MQHLSFAKENIEKYQRIEAIEFLKVVAYHFAELLAVVGIFGLGLGIIAFL